MAFMFWIFLLLPAMALYVLVEKVLSPFSGVLGPVLELLNDRAFVYGAIKILLVVSVLVLAVLLAVRFRWKRAGKLSRDYIYSVQGWRRLCRWLAGPVLHLWLFWELFLVVFCALVLIFEVGGPMP